MIQRNAKVIHKNADKSNMNTKPDHRKQHLDLRIRNVIIQTDQNGGTFSWPKVPDDAHDPGQAFLWHEEPQSLVRAAGYTLEITLREARLVDGQTNFIPEQVTIKSPDFIKKENLKNKMKQEFGYSDES